MGRPGQTTLVCVAWLMAACGRISYVAPYPAEPRDGGAPPDAAGADAGAPGDSASGDSASGDSASGDSAGSAPIPSNDPCSEYPNALFCDSFDEGLGGEARLVRNGGEATWEADVGRNGGGGIRTVVPAGRVEGPVQWGGGYLVAYFPVQMGIDLYARAYLRVRSPLDLEGAGVVLSVTGETVGLTEKTSIDLLPDRCLQLVASSSRAPGSVETVCPDRIPLDDWVCLEVHVHMAPEGAGGLAEALLNDQPLGSTASDIDTEPTNGYSFVQVGAVGLELQSDGLAVDIDDVVIATEPIGCGS